MKIGLIGLGVISKYYLAALNTRQDVTLGAVCDIDPTKGASFQDKGVFFTTDYKELISRDDISGVIVNVPNHLHYEICRSALLAGRHVCCEKPLTISYNDAERLTELATARERILFTAFHRRYNSHVINLANYLQDAPPIRTIQARYYEKIEEHCGRDKWYLDPAKCGGGCIADNGPNVFDTLLYLLGPLEVVSATVTYNSLGIDVQAEISLQSHNGIRAEVLLDWEYPDGEKKDLSLLMENGTQVYADMLAGYSAFKSSLYHEYEGILEDFISLINGQKHQPDTGGEVVRLVETAYRCAQPMKRSEVEVNR
jgi:predicted dehydrogenase